MNASTLQKSWKWYSSGGFILRNKNVWASETFVHQTAYILQYFKLERKKNKSCCILSGERRGVTLTIGLAYKNLHPRCTPLTGIKVASIVSSNSLPEKVKACSQNVKLILWFLQFCVFKVFPLQLSTHVRRLFPPRDYFIEVQQVD